MFDSKLVISVITGAVAAAAAVRQDLDTLFAGRKSHLSQINDEEKRIEQINKSLQMLNTDGESYVAARQALENDRRVALERLKRLTAEFSRQREDPNYDLSFIQRLFLLFQPEKGRAEIVHLLAGAFMVLGLTSIACGVWLGNHQLPHDHHEQIEELIADFAVLGCYGTLLFRAWALAERRWSHGYDSNSTLRKALVVLKGPASARVRWAQACFWVCLYWVIESAEDFIQDVFARNDLHVSAALLKFLAPLVAALFCRNWVAAELKHTGTPLTSHWKLSTLFGRGWSALAMVTSVAGLAGSITILVCRPAFFNELEHQIALALQALISCMACSRQLDLSPHLAVSAAYESMPAKTKSAAA
jgi:hypothetical protein